MKREKAVQSHRELEVYTLAFEAAMKIFELTKDFPSEEHYSLTNQIRRSSKSVCANIADAWRKRRYEAAFVSTLCDSESEAAETQTWLEFSVKCGYLGKDVGNELYETYDWIVGTLVNMITNPRPWLMKRS